MRSFLTLSFLVLWTAAGSAQTIRVANNNANAPSGDNIYPTLQEAVDAAESGDVIHVIPSRTAYGNMTISKPLTILGIGFNPDKDIPLRSIIGGITLSEGASGTRIAGFGYKSSVVIGTELKDIVIESFHGTIDGGLATENILITNCILDPK